MSNARVDAEQAAIILSELLARSSTYEQLRSRVEHVVSLYRSASSALGRDEADRITQHVRKQLELLASDPHRLTLAANVLKELRGGKSKQRARGRALGAEEVNVADRRYTLNEITPLGQDGRTWELVFIDDDITFVLTLAGREMHSVPGGTEPIDRPFTETEIRHAVVGVAKDALVRPPEKQRGMRYAESVTRFDLYRAAGIAC